MPLVASFATENVWLKESAYREQPLVRFKEQLFVTAGNGTKALGYSSEEALKGLLPEEARREWW